MLERRIYNSDNSFREKLSIIKFSTFKALPTKKYDKLLAEEVTD